MAKSKRKMSGPPDSPSLLMHIIGDATSSFLFVLASSLIGEIAEMLHVRFPNAGGEFFIGIMLLLLFLLAFSPVCSLLSGAIFNPVNSFALALSGKGKLTPHVIRMGAQIAGALGGTYAATEIVPEAFQGKFRYNAGALREGVQLEHGCLCEVALGFSACLLFLFSTDMKNKRLAFWLPLFATAGWCYVGSYLTGPSMNPSLAFSWNWHFGTHTLKEHIVVFWLGPFLGSGLAGLSYLWLTSSAAKFKAAKRKGTRSSPRTKRASGTGTPGGDSIAQGVSHGSGNKTVDSSGNGTANDGSEGLRRRVAAAGNGDAATPGKQRKASGSRAS